MDLEGSVFRILHSRKNAYVFVDVYVRDYLLMTRVWVILTIWIPVLLTMIINISKKIWNVAVFFSYLFYSRSEKFS